MTSAATGVSDLAEEAAGRGVGYSAAAALGRYACRTEECW
jgi:hypothetical protein